MRMACQDQQPRRISGTIRAYHGQRTGSKPSPHDRGGYLCLRHIHPRMLHPNLQSHSLLQSRGVRNPTPIVSHRYLSQYKDGKYFASVTDVLVSAWQDRGEIDCQSLTDAGQVYSKIAECCPGRRNLKQGQKIQALNANRGRRGDRNPLRLGPILSVAKDSYRLATGSPDSMTKLEVTVTVTPAVRLGSSHV